MGTLKETCRQYVDRRLSEGWSIVGRYGKHNVILSPPEGDFIKVVDLRHDTATLRPNANGTYQDFPYQYPSGGSHYDKVDDVTPDDESTFVRGSPTGFPYGTYVGLYTSGESFVGDYKVTTTSFVTYNKVFTENPWTSDDWDEDELDDLEAGIKHYFPIESETYHLGAFGESGVIINSVTSYARIRLHYGAGQYTCRLTQVYVEIDWELAIIEKTLTSSFAVGSNINKEADKTYSDGLELGSSINKLIIKELSAGIAIASSVVAAIIFTVTVISALAINSSVGKWLSKTLTSGIATGSSVDKQITKVLTSGVAISANTIKWVYKTLTSGISYTASASRIIELILVSGIKIGSCAIKWRWLEAIRNLARARCPPPRVRELEKVDDGLTGP